MKKVVVLSTSLRAGSNSRIDSYEKCTLNGHLFCGGVNGPREISGHAKLQEAYNIGKAI